MDERLERMRALCERFETQPLTAIQTQAVLGDLVDEFRCMDDLLSNRGALIPSDWM